MIFHSALETPRKGNVKIQSKNLKIFVAKSFTILKLKKINYNARNIVCITIIRFDKEETERNYGCLEFI